MYKYLVALIAAIFAVAGAFAQPITGEAYIEFAKFRTPEGRIIEVGGYSVPITITPIEAKKANKGKHRGWKNFNLGDSVFGPTVYTNDNGNTTNFYTPGMSSALDDLLLTSAANNRPWESLKMGLRLDGRTTDFQIRWLGWESFTGGLGPGVNAFSNLLFDVGWNLPIAQFGTTTGAFEITFPLGTVPFFIVPNQTCYFAQQFRDQHPEGEGAFAPNIATVFSGSGVTTGSSADSFYYDFDPVQDGKYDETELDHYGGPPNDANFLLDISVGGSAETSIPSGYNWIRGVEQAGNLGSYWFDDDNYGVARAGAVLFPGESPAQLVVDSFVSTSAITSMRIDVVSKANTPGLNMKIELFNFVTNSYDVVHDGAASTSETTVQALAGALAFMYVSNTSTVRAKISWYQTSAVLFWPWGVSVDQVQWLITIP